MPGPEPCTVGGFWGAHCPGGGRLAGAAHSTCALLHGRGQGMHLPRGKGSGLGKGILGWGNGRSKEVEAGHIRWRQRFS